ncbi:unnamed protein product [Prorocentrum cordatum]|uniref:Uncharacterized protein n=1 Tax=Prorocentrum cordatum TaxID=2364126 RepID=A0ABN9PX90_9DINO|nr:unnamed protein product [Polarella glacialis]
MFPPSFGWCPRAAVPPERRGGADPHLGGQRQHDLVLGRDREEGGRAGGGREAVADEERAGQALRRDRRRQQRDHRGERVEGKSDGRPHHDRVFAGGHSHGEERTERRLRGSGDVQHAGLLHAEEYQFRGVRAVPREGRPRPRRPALRAEDPAAAGASGAGPPVDQDEDRISLPPVQGPGPRGRFLKPYGPPRRGFERAWNPEPERAPEPERLQVFQLAVRACQGTC